MTGRPLEELFRQHFLLRAVIDAALEGRGGRVLTLSSSAPRAALLEFGCYLVPGGDPASQEARELLGHRIGPCEIVVPDRVGWRGLIEEVFGTRVRDRSMESFVPGSELKTRIRTFAGERPTGYELRPLDAETAAMAGRELSPHGIDVLGGPARFVESGFGWGLLIDDVLVCAATSYAVSARYVEVAIATHPAHRRRGLAACAASAMIGEALDRGLQPHWNAHNPVSKRLARRLGFVGAGLCEILALDFDDPPGQAKAYLVDRRGAPGGK